jgi:hypothetical protein
LDLFFLLLTAAEPPELLLGLPDDDELPEGLFFAADCGGLWGGRLPPAPEGELRCAAFPKLTSGFSEDALPGLLTFAIFQALSFRSFTLSILFILFPI